METYDRINYLLSIIEWSNGPSDPIVSEVLYLLDQIKDLKYISELITFRKFPYAPSNMLLRKFTIYEPFEDEFSIGQKLKKDVRYHIGAYYPCKVFTRKDSGLITEIYKEVGVLSNSHNRPAVLTKTPQGQVVHEEYIVDGEHVDGYSVVSYFPNGNKSAEFHYLKGELNDLDDEPAVKYYDQEGNMIGYDHYRGGKLHSYDHPASSRTNPDGELQVSFFIDGVECDEEQFYEISLDLKAQEEAEKELKLEEKLEELESDSEEELEDQLEGLALEEDLELYFESDYEDDEDIIEYAMKEAEKELFS